MKYYKIVSFMSGDPLALIRIENSNVERYAGLGRWVEPSHWAEILSDIAGGEGWSKYEEISPDEAESVKLELFPYLW